MRAQLSLLWMHRGRCLSVHSSLELIELCDLVMLFRIQSTINASTWSKVSRSSTSEKSSAGDAKIGSHQKKCTNTRTFFKEFGNNHAVFGTVHTIKDIVEPLYLIRMG